MARIGVEKKIFETLSDEDGKNFSSEELADKTGIDPELMSVPPRRDPKDRPMPNLPM
jgi:NADH/NAD ratio-sensing transcriptional regulator Rex